MLAIVDRLAPQPKGPKSSSYATSPQGLAAYAAVLERNGRPVRRLRTAIADQPPRDGETLVVLDPQALEPKETRAIGKWVKAGGHLVAGGAIDASWLDEVLEKPPEFDPDGELDHDVLAPIAGVNAVRSAGNGAWSQLGGALPVIGPRDAPLVVTARAGEGRVTLIADASPLSNQGLASADNAALGLALVGSGPVAFLETVHGYGVSRGVGGLPTNVKWTLLGLALTAIVAAWAAGRRFGPTEDPDVPLPPPRVEYVEAVAATLVKTKENE